MEELAPVKITQQMSMHLSMSKEHVLTNRLTIHAHPTNIFNGREIIQTIITPKKKGLGNWGKPTIIYSWAGHEKEYTDLKKMLYDVGLKFQE